jgi:hypothetical protein
MHCRTDEVQAPQENKIDRIPLNLVNCVVLFITVVLQDEPGELGQPVLLAGKVNNSQAFAAP